MSSARGFVAVLVPALSLALSVLTLCSDAKAAPGAFDLSAPANGAWCKATCVFSWGAAPSAASYDVYVDGTLKHPAVIATTYALAAGEAMPDGMHTWYVVARDSGAGTTQSTSTFSVRADASPPSPPGLSSPAASSWVGSASPTFSWTASTDAGSGLSGYEIWINGAPANTGIAPSATSATANLPNETILDTSFSTWGTCPGSWRLDGAGWGCAYSGGIVHLTFATGYFVGTKIGTATMPGTLDLSNAGHADLVIYEGEANPTSTLQINSSNDAGMTWQVVKTLPISQQIQSAKDTFSLDDALGSASAKIQFYGSANPNEGWSIDWLQVNSVLGGSYSWQVVALDAAGNRTASETRQLQFDLPPLPFDLVAPANGTWLDTHTRPMRAVEASLNALRNRVRVAHRVPIRVDRRL